MCFEKVVDDGQFALINGFVLSSTWGQKLGRRQVS